MSLQVHRAETLLAPWLIDVDVFHTAVAHVGWDSIGINSSHLMNGYKNSSAAQNDEIEFDVVLGTGTWTLELVYAGRTDGGIYTVTIDGVSVGTVDGYDASNTDNKRGSLTGLVMTSGKKRLKVKMATKNASSTNYRGLLAHIQFRRTA